MEENINLASILSSYGNGAGFSSPYFIDKKEEKKVEKDKIDFKKPLITRIGFKVTRISVTLSAALPYRGLVEGSRIEHSWRADGRHKTDTELDLFNVEAKNED